MSKIKFLCKQRQLHWLGISFYAFGVYDVYFWVSAHYSLHSLVRDLIGNEKEMCVHKFNSLEQNDRNTIVLWEHEIKVGDSSDTQHILLQRYYTATFLSVDIPNPKIVKFEFFQSLITRNELLRVWQAL